MQEVALAFAAGAAVGALFTVIGLPIPAPPVLSGVMGVVGVWAGAAATLWIQAQLAAGG